MHTKLQSINVVRKIAWNQQKSYPGNFCLYKHSLLLHSLYNTQKPHLEWLALNFNQNFNSREKTLKIINNSNYKIGKNNKLSNRLVILNNKIELDCLNTDKNTYKLLCKQKFIATEWKQDKHSLIPSNKLYYYFAIFITSNGVVHSYKVY